MLLNRCCNLKIEPLPAQITIIKHVHALQTCTLVVKNILIFSILTITQAELWKEHTLIRILSIIIKTSCFGDILMLKILCLVLILFYSKKNKISIFNLTSKALSPLKVEYLLKKFWFKAAQNQFQKFLKFQ